MSGKSKAGILYLLLLMVLLTACGKDTEQRPMKVFKYNQGNGLTSLDPAFARSQGNIWATTQLFNGLVELDQDLNVVPALAERWNVSQDGLTYTFHLQDSVYFHENDVFGEAKTRLMTAEDVVYSFRRLLDPTTSSTGSWIFNDKVLRDRNGNISDTSFMALDEHTVRIHLEKTFPAFLEILAMPYAFVVPREGVEHYGKDFRSNPIGTGAFRFGLWEEGANLILYKNDRYWRKDAQGERLPYLDAVHITFLTDKNQAFLTFLQGKIDFLSDVNENSREEVLNYDGTVREQFRDRFQVVKGPYLNTEYLGIQLDSSYYDSENDPLLDLRVRQALNYGFDRKDMITYILNNKGIPGTSGFIPAALPSFDADKVKGYNYDLAKARELLKAAGYPNGKGMAPIKLYTIGEYPYREISEYLQKQWSDLGIKVRLEVNPSATLRELIDKGRAFLFRASWLGDYPDAENYLTCFYGNNFAPAGPNKTHFRNAKFDSLYKASLKVTDVSERYQMYRQMDQLVMDHAPIIVLFYDELIRLAQKDISGLESNAMNMLILEKVDKPAEL